MANHADGKWTRKSLPYRKPIHFSSTCNPSLIVVNFVSNMLLAFTVPAINQYARLHT